MPGSGKHGKRTVYVTKDGIRVVHDRDVPLFTAIEETAQLHRVGQVYDACGLIRPRRSALDDTAVAGEKPGKASQKRRLARSRIADDGNGLSVRDVELDIDECARPRSAAAKTHFECFVQRAHADEMRRVHAGSWATRREW